MTRTNEMNGPLLAEVRTGLVSAIDAVHGVIDLRDIEGSGFSNCIVNLLSTRMMRRLHGIKQLGNVSHAFPAADHSRYAHALGTLHTMRLMLKRLDETGLFTRDFVDEVVKSFPVAFSASDDQPGSPTRWRSILQQHMLIAALLQDVGELPYHQALQYVYRLERSACQSVQSSVIGFTFDGRNVKETFTLAAVLDQQNELPTNIDRRLLAFLIAGRPTPRPQDRALKTLRHMLDGLVDADRLDYVFRDAHHTTGATGSARDVIESFATVDEQGPVFTDPRPIASFLATRAHLWTSVYFSPPQRLQLLLLLTLFRQLEAHRPTQTPAEVPWPGEITLNQFLDFDGVQVAKVLASAEMLEGGLDASAREAARLLRRGVREYDYRWLPLSSTSAARKGKLQSDGAPFRANKHGDIEHNIFFDTFSDYDEHRLYSAGVARLTSPAFEFIGTILSLERCCGPFNVMLSKASSALPLPGHLLAFAPRDVLQRDPKFRSRINDGSIERIARERDPYRFPIVFISYNAKDLVQFEDLALKLRGRCIEVVHGTYLDGGEYWPQIKERIRTSEVVLVFVTKSGIGKTQRKEIRLTHGLYGKRRLQPFTVALESAAVHSSSYEAKYSRYQLDVPGNFEKLVKAIYRCPRRPRASQ